MLISNEGQAGNQHIQECGNLVLLPHGIPSTMLSVSNVSCDGESGKFKANADNIGWQGAVISRVFKHVWGTKEMAKTSFIFNHFQMVKVVNVNVPFSPSFFVFVVPFWVNIKKRTQMEFHTTGVLFVQEPLAQPRLGIGGTLVT